MANWRTKINLAGVLRNAPDGELDEPCEQSVKDAICAELARAPTLNQFCARIRRATTNHRVNKILSDVYGVADATGVWCGGA